ncbi:MAG TPA: DNA-3-methyladenine glycosylase I [Tepidisphaeraceae bacterium]
MLCEFCEFGEFGSFDKHVWQFVYGKARQNRFESMKEIPARTEQSDVMSKDLIRRGFKFVGSTICTLICRRRGW